MSGLVFLKCMKAKCIMLICLLISLVWMCCTVPAKKQAEPNPFLTATTGVEMDKRFLKADSLVFVFYKDPYGKDSLRYTRYYTQWSTTDSNDISLLIKNLTKPFTKFEKVKNCRSEGKVWCFINGNIFQTVSFATQCSSSCCFIYFIRDGYFFYTPLDTTLSQKLVSIKALSKNNVEIK